MNASAVATNIPVERRFPLDLHEADDRIRALYETAKQSHWNPDTDIDWATHQLDALDDATRDACRRVWSRRAWVEYTGMAATPALLIRFCLELNRESDPKYFLAVRNTEEAWHIECFHRYAETAGGYVDRPDNAAWETVFNQNQYRDALDAGVPIDTQVAVHCAFVDSLEHRLARGWASNATEPLAHALIERCLPDYERHARFGLLYAERRATTLDTAQRGQVAQALVDYITRVEFAGYHCAGLATRIDPSPECADLDRVAAAGLGACSAADEIACFRTAIEQTRVAMGTLGLELPGIDHPRLGRF
jgi:hypothetical protein